MRAGSIMWSLGLLFHPSVQAYTHICPKGGRNFGTHCKISVELANNTATELVCIENDPLNFKVLLSGKLLRLFDREVFTVQRKSLINDVRIHVSSEDTWLAGTTGWTTSMTAEEQVRARFRANSSNVEDSLQRLRASVAALWGENSGDSYSQAVSPFGTACIGLKAFSTRGAGELTIKVRREGPKVNSLWRKEGARDDSGAEGGAIKLWLRPLLLVFGFALFAHASTLASSVVFHYASCVSLFTLLSVVLIVAIIFWRTGPRGRFMAVATMTAMGVTLTALRDSALEFCRLYWPYVLAWLGFFAVLGFALTFWRLKGGRPEAHETALLSFTLKVCALAVIYISCLSLRASVTLVVLTVLLYGLPGSAPLWRSYWLVRHGAAAAEAKASLWSGPAGQPKSYIDEGGRERVWVPPTRSGRFMSEAEYEAQGEIATDAALDKLFASPEYRRWLKENHKRIALEPSDAAQAVADDADDE